MLYILDLCSKFALRKTKVAAIAQLVERFTRNEKVLGSSPGCGSSIKNKWFSYKKDLA